MYLGRNLPTLLFTKGTYPLNIETVVGIISFVFCAFRFRLDKRVSETINKQNKIDK